MRRHPERLHLAAWLGPERGYRPPTPYPDDKQPKFKSRYSGQHVDITRYRHRYTGDLERKTREQNARIARRPYAQSLHFEREQPVQRRVRFSLPTSRRDKDDLEGLARELAKLSIRDPGSSRRRCSRCGQELAYRGGDRLEHV